MKSLKIVAILALAGVSIFAQSANAATTVYNDGDIMLGIRATGGTGASSDILVNLGQVSQFDHSFTLSLGNLGADLSSVFGSSWFTRTDVLFSVTGGTLVDNTLCTTSNSPKVFLHGVDQAGGSTFADQLGSNYASNASTANSDVAIIQAAGGDNSYASFQPGGSNSGGISFQQWNPFNEGAIGLGLTFQQLNEGQGESVIGLFNFTSTGDVAFTVPPVTNPVPEPGSVAALAAAGIGMLAFARRRLIGA